MRPSTARIPTAPPIAISHTCCAVSAWTAANVIVCIALASVRASANSVSQIDRRRGKNKDHDERRNTQESSQREMILASDQPANLLHRAQPPPTGPLRELSPDSAGVHRHDDGYPDGAAEQRSEQNRKEGIPCSEKCANHQHHLHVAHSHAFFVTHQFVERRRAPEHEAAKCRAQ